MFYNCTSLEVIYASSSFSTSKISTSDTSYYHYVFSSDTKLV